MSLYTVRAILILDNDGERLVAKHYAGSSAGATNTGGGGGAVLESLKEQRAFERRLHSKVARNPTGDVLLLDGFTCVFRSNVDLVFCVLGDASENELILYSVLNALYDAVSQILRKNVEKRCLLQYLDLIYLAVDELCDSGVVMETDPGLLVSRVGSTKLDESSPLEGSVTQVLQHATQQFKWSLLK